MAVMQWRECTACKVTYEVLTAHGESIGMTPDDNSPNCPGCQSELYRSIITAPTGIELGGEGGYGRHYPYFDRGLGMRISSASHRRKVCKQRGLIPVEGDFDHEREFSQRMKPEDDLLKKHAEYTDRLDNSPEFAEYREMQAKGIFDDQWSLENRQKRRQ